MGRSRDRRVLQLLGVDGRDAIRLTSSRPVFFKGFPFWNLLGCMIKI